MIFHRYPIERADDDLISDKYGDVDICHQSINSFVGNHLVRLIMNELTSEDGIDCKWTEIAVYRFCGDFYGDAMKLSLANTIVLGTPKDSFMIRYYRSDMVCKPGSDFMEESMKKYMEVVDSFFYV